jgi:hypothetical protein
LATSGSPEEHMISSGFGVYLATGTEERIGEDNAEEEQLFCDLWEDETQRGMVIESLKAD